jgi:hypothetical protein
LATTTTSKFDSEQVTWGLLLRGAMVFIGLSAPSLNRLLRECGELPTETER